MNLNTVGLIINNLRILRLQGFNARIFRGILTPALSNPMGEMVLDSWHEGIRTSKRAKARAPRDYHG
jgi:hypothetical protein